MNSTMGLSEVRLVVDVSLHWMTRLSLKKRNTHIHSMVRITQMITLRISIGLLGLFTEHGSFRGGCAIFKEMINYTCAGFVCLYVQSYCSPNVARNQLLFFVFSVGTGASPVPTDSLLASV